MGFVCDTVFHHVFEVAGQSTNGQIVFRDGDMPVSEFGGNLDMSTMDKMNENRRQGYLQFFIAPKESKPRSEEIIKGEVFCGKERGRKSVKSENYSIRVYSTD